MVNRLTFDATLLGAGRFVEAARDVSGTLQQNRREWNVNIDLIWSGLHLLARALEAAGKYEEAVNAAREAMKFTPPPSSQELSSRVQRAIAARDFASAVSHWKDARPDTRAEALQALPLADGLDERYAVLTGALIDRPPQSSEIASIRQRLSSDGAAGTSGNSRGTSHRPLR